MRLIDFIVMPIRQLYDEIVYVLTWPTEYVKRIRNDKKQIRCRLGIHGRLRFQKLDGAWILDHLTTIGQFKCDNCKKIIRMDMQ